MNMMQAELERDAAHFKELALAHIKSDPLNDGVNAIHAAGWAAGRKSGYDMGFRDGRSAISGGRVLAVWASIAIGVAVAFYIFATVLTWVQP